MNDSGHEHGGQLSFRSVVKKDCWQSLSQTVGAQEHGLGFAMQVVRTSTVAPWVSDFSVGGERESGAPQLRCTTVNVPSSSRYLCSPG